MCGKVVSCVSAMPRAIPVGVQSPCRQAEVFM